MSTYKYLGTMLGESWQADFQRRRKLAWGVINEYDRVWRSQAAFDAKKQLFVALVEPILLYGAFTYPDTQEVSEALHHTYARMLRRCVGLGRADPTKRPTSRLSICTLDETKLEARLGSPPN